MAARKIEELCGLISNVPKKPVASKGNICKRIYSFQCSRPSPCGYPSNRGFLRPF